jgi:hypothetical protein
MNHEAFGSAGIAVHARDEMVRGSAQIHLDRDALSPRGWLSRRGRRLLEGPGALLSEIESWLDLQGMSHELRPNGYLS